MVWVKNVGMLPAYVCDSCGYGYRDAKVALECERRCKTGMHPSDIKSKAVYQP
jgi:rubredoxin